MFLSQVFVAGACCNADLQGIKINRAKSNCGKPPFATKSETVSCA